MARRAWRRWGGGRELKEFAPLKDIGILCYNRFHIVNRHRQTWATPTFSFVDGDAKVYDGTGAHLPHILE